MTKFLTKSLISIGILAAAIIPIGAAVACGDGSSTSTQDTVERSACVSTNQNNVTLDPNRDATTKVVTVQVEPDVVPLMQTAIYNLKSEKSAVLKAQGIDNINVMTINSAFDTENLVTTKGYKDESLGDLFLIPSDKLPFYTEKKAIKPYWEKDVNYFAKTCVGENEVFESSAIPLKDSKGNVYGVPQNIEAMVAFTDSNPAITNANVQNNLITNFSDLWKAAGFFNTETKNFKDVVSRNLTNGNIFRNEDAISKDDVTVGFTNVLNHIKGSGLDNITDFDVDAGKAAPTVNIAWAKSQSNLTSAKALITGPWDLKTLIEANKDSPTSTRTVKAFSPANYNQWSGGWSYALNARMTDNEQIVAEMLVGELLKPKYAIQSYTDSGKLSSLTSGRQAIQSAEANDITSDKKAIAEAVYGTKKIERPTKSEFGIVWAEYAATISQNAAQLTKLALNDATATVTAKSLAELFETRLAAAIKKSNDNLGS